MSANIPNFGDDVLPSKKGALSAEQAALLAAHDAHPTPRPTPERDRFGRYVLRHPVSGKSKGYTRVTTVAKVLDDGYGIQRWLVGMVALGMAENPHLVREVLALDDPDGDDKGRLRGKADEAKELAGGSVKAEVGTAIHSFTEHHDMGTGVKAPAPYDADVNAYAACLKAHGIEAPGEWVERILMNTDRDLVGTTDRIVRLPDGRLVILDVKTGSVGYSWVSMAVQLAAYSTASHMLGVDGTWETMPEGLDPTTGIIAHVPAGQGECTLYELDLTKGLALLDLCIEVRGARKTKKLAEVMPTPEVAPVEVAAEVVVEAFGAETVEVSGREADAEPSLDTDEAVVELVRSWKKSASRDEVLDVRAAWDESGAPKQPPWTDAERAVVVDLVAPSWSDADNSPELVAKREAREAREQKASETIAQVMSEPVPLPPLPADGESLDLAGTREMLADLKVTAPAAASALSSWVKEAGAAGRPLGGERFDARRQVVVNEAAAFCMRVGGGYPELNAELRVKLAEVLGVAVVDHSTGAVLGSLTAEQAEALNQ